MAEQFTAGELRAIGFLAEDLTEACSRPEVAAEAMSLGECVVFCDGTPIGILDWEDDGFMFRVGEPAKPS